MNYLAGLFSILGFLVHWRKFRLFSDPVLIDCFKKFQEGEATILDRFLGITAPWTAYLFYLTCIGFCFLSWSNRLTSFILFSVFVACAPYYLALYNLDPGTARLGLYSGGAILFYHMTRTNPKKKQDSRNQLLERVD